MPDYDVIIKELLNASVEMFRQLRIAPVTEWLNVELPKVHNPRVDLLGKTRLGELVHIELQSTNHPLMPLRMAEYALAILRRYRKYPHQLVLYVGNGALTMRPRLQTHGMLFQYEQIDIRAMDGGKLLASRCLADNLLAVFARLDDSREGIRQILRKIAGLKKSQRSDELSRLFAAAELRGLQHTVSEEICNMPIIHRTSINDKTFGPWIRKGLQQGLEQGREQGLERGRKEGSQETVRFALEQRFGALSADVDRRLGKLSETQLKQLLAGVIAGKNLDELFPSPKSRRSRP